MTNIHKQLQRGDFEFDNNKSVTPSRTRSRDKIFVLYIYILYTRYNIIMLPRIYGKREKRDFKNKSCEYLLYAIKG